MQKIDWEIIYRKVNGSISKQDEIKLENWLQGSESHRDYYQKVIQFYEKSEEELQEVPDHLDQFISRLQTKRRRLFIDRVQSYAAVIMLPLLVATGVFLKSTIEKNEQLAKLTKSQLEMPVIKNQAVLITSNGETHELKADEFLQINDQSGVVIRRNNESGLKYENIASVANEQLAYNTLKTAKGGEYQLELADGTMVHLNCDSELKYPVAFGADERRVQLKGEAYFDVRKNGKPFIVQVDDMAVKVLGTKFNVMAYQDEESVQTTLVSGKVRVFVNAEGKSESLDLSPGKQSGWNKSLGILSSREVDVNLYTSWVDGYFRFENQKLEDLMKTISRWYDVKILYQQSALKGKRLTGKLYRFDNFSVITEMIEKISGVKIEHTEQTILISNK
ncbi:FecR family protein [Marinifilum flexuosum]|uniref:FecR family protein n=1 Tax=Marinifilum flexuosum TaxID=1117708 RepID=A0A419X3H3_9BACT|nr:FecR domain-containing protein [Marinifilum flexuosum]RKE02252.1 FecR family protein [Marinifilum flexuosum]